MQLVYSELLCIKFRDIQARLFQSKPANMRISAFASLIPIQEAFKSIVFKSAFYSNEKGIEMLRSSFSSGEPSD
jgi:hypothetical protein